MTTHKTIGNTLQPSILSFVKDIPNLCSLAGLACTICAIYFSVLGIYYAAMIGMVWAVAFDWADGLIARSLKNRTVNNQNFGGQLDLLIDIVSYGVAPAILLISFGHFNPIFLIGAFIMLSAGAIRLSYFSTFGLSDEGNYTGLALDNNNLILVLIFLFEGFFSEVIFPGILYGSCICVAVLNVSQIKIPKLSGKPLNVYILAFYTVTITIIYAYKLS
jgi:phosphatidylserine synthase